MTKNTLLAAVAVAAISSLTAVAAHANPIYIGYSIDGGKTITDIGSSGNDGTAGTGGTTATAAGFNIQISATGQASGAPTSLFSNTLTVSSVSGGSIILYASEINNTSRAPSFTTGFSNDGQSTANVMESSYLGLSNSKYSITTPFALASATVGPAVGTPNSTVTAPGNLPSTYSLTEAYAVTLGASGRLIATLSVTSPAASVPEPISLSLLGSGLIGVGLIRRKRA